MSKTVLIVEDNELHMKMFSDLLQNEGYNILQSTDGTDALDIVREHKPDLVIMDVQLPEISGLNITDSIKEDNELKDIPVIAVTAFAMKGDEARIIESGCDYYIAKPIFVPDFLAAVADFIGR